MSEPLLAGPLAPAVMRNVYVLGPGKLTIEFADILAALAADPRTVEAIAEALGSTGECGHSSCPRDTSRHLGEAAAIRDALFGAPK